MRRETLARLATRLHLGEYLLLGHGEQESGGRQRPATLCATFEALVGALYLDQDMEVCRTVVLRLFAAELARIDQKPENRDAKSKLQELAQETFNHTPRYKPVSYTHLDVYKRQFQHFTKRTQSHQEHKGRHLQLCVFVSSCEAKS